MLLLVVGIIMLICSNWIYSIWVGTQITVPLTFSALICAWVILLAWNSIFSYFVNGIGKITLQMCMGITCAVINVPLAIYLGIKFGVNGIIIANIFITGFQSIIISIQYNKLIHGNASGIWIR